MRELGLTIDPNSPLSLAEQIVAGVRQRIDDRVLRAGMRLPPIRAMATALGVSRFTVVEAYDRLVARGLVGSRRGSGFYVTAFPERAPANASPDADRAFERALDNAGILREALKDDPQRIKVGGGWLPQGWLDDDAVRRRLRALTRDGTVPLTQYGEPQGYAPLREQLEIRLAALGIPARMTQIVLTTGATQALDIVGRTLLRSGDCALVDDPGYWNLFASLRLLGVRLVGVPRGREGPDLATLDALAAEHRPKAYFTQSALQNPTSGDIHPSVAHRTLELAARHDFLIVEDDIYVDFDPGAPRQIARLAALDGLDRVIYIGSFSKTLSGNLRVGFLAARPDLARTFTDVKLFTSLGCSELAERTIHGLLAEGQYRKLTQRLRDRVAAATEHALRLLERAGFSVWAEPRGGMFLWAERSGEDPTELARRAAEGGILLAPGHLFRPQLQHTSFSRFNVTAMSDPRVARFLLDGE